MKASKIVHRNEPRIRVDFPTSRYKRGAVRIKQFITNHKADV